MNDNRTPVNKALAKVPEVTLLFWIIKIFCTTLGETGGDAVSMSMGLGYLVGTAIFSAIFLIAVGVQIKAPKFNAIIYWVTIIATTTVGTTMADFADRSLGIGYAGGSSILLLLLLASLVVWYKVMGSISIDTVNTPKVEVFYWVTIMFSQTLGTALGDWTSDSMGLGYAASTGVFLGLLFVVYLLYRRTRVSHAILFWAAFVLTRPLGAVVGDLLDKPIAHGGFAFSRYDASGVLALLIACSIFLFPQRAAEKAH